MRSEPAPGRLRSRLDIPASPLGFVDSKLKYTENLYKKGRTAMLCRAAVSGANQVNLDKPGIVESCNMGATCTLGRSRDSDAEQMQLDAELD